MTPSHEASMVMANSKWIHIMCRKQNKTYYVLLIAGYHHSPNLPSQWPMSQNPPQIPIITVNFLSKALFQSTPAIMALVQVLYSPPALLQSNYWAHWASHIKSYILNIIMLDTVSGIENRQWTSLTKILDLTEYILVEISPSSRSSVNQWSPKCNPGANSINIT